MNENILFNEAAEDTATYEIKKPTKQDHPGVYIPPPLLYVACFLFSVLLQKVMPLGGFIKGTTTASILGLLFISLYLATFLPALLKFIASKNTLVTIKPATRLQTSGIYAITRNPMYLSLLFLYTGIAMFKGNWHTLLMLPVLIAIVQVYVIGKEERYLQRTFGVEYGKYQASVRRWI